MTTDICVYNLDKHGRLDIILLNFKDFKKEKLLKKDKI
jgi:hypothetical protein